MTDQVAEFSDDHQTEWSERVLKEGALPTTIPDRLCDDITVPLAFVIDEPFGAVLHVMLWPDDGAPSCDVEVLVRDDSGWSYMGSGGSAWPSARLVDLGVDELGGQAMFVLGECEIGVPGVGVGAFTYGVVSDQAGGVEFTDPGGERRRWPKMRCGAFVIPTRFVASALAPWS